MRQTTVRIRNQFGETFGEWFVEPGDNKRIAQIKAELAEYQKEEPNSGWKLQTRGTLSDWHNWKD
jgi:hypothetical protein